MKSHRIENRAIVGYYRGPLCIWWRGFKTFNPSHMVYALAYRRPVPAWAPKRLRSCVRRAPLCRPTRPLRWPVRVYNNSIDISLIRYARR